MAAAIVLGLVADTALLPCANQAFASSGCCMVRETLSDTWRRSEETLEKCELRNAKEDGDNVFDDSGLVWWDLDCSA